MVIPEPKSRRRRQAALLMIDLLVGMAFLTIAIVPLAMSFSQTQRSLLVTYQRAVAMEIVDGEMELLVAGEWRSYPKGVYSLTPHANAATNLPPGRLQLEVANKHLVLEWRPDHATQNGSIRREVTLK